MSIKTPNEYKQHLNFLYNNYLNLLDIISKNFIDYKINPRHKEFLTDYRNNINNLVKLENEIISTKNKLKNSTNNIQKKINILNKKTHNLNKKNKILLKQLNNLENQDFAASGELENRQKIYYEKLSQNIILFIILLLFIIKIVRRK